MGLLCTQLHSLITGIASHIALYLSCTTVEERNQVKARIVHSDMCIFDHHVDGVKCLSEECPQPELYVPLGHDWLVQLHELHSKIMNYLP